MSNFSAFDIICTVLILIFTVRCALRGFISEVMSMAAIVLGLLASLCFFKNGGEFVCDRYMPEHRTIADIIAFILLFLIVFLVIKILERLLKDIIEGIKLGRADRFLGLLFGLLEGFIVVSLVLFLIFIQPLFDPHAVLNNSFFAGILLPLIIGDRIEVVDTVMLIIPRIAGAGINV
jgi:membrane protein required for colicin V production